MFHQASLLDVLVSRRHLLNEFSGTTSYFVYWHENLEIRIKKCYCTGQECIGKDGKQKRIRLSLYSNISWRMHMGYVIALAFLQEDVLWRIHTKPQTQTLQPWFVVSERRRQPHLHVKYIEPHHYALCRYLFVLSCRLLSSKIWLSAYFPLIFGPPSLVSLDFLGGACCTA